MNETIISNWNNTVATNDIIYLLGDVSFEKDKTKLDSMLSQLNGEKHIIWGNHDTMLRSTKWQHHFKSAADLCRIWVPPESNNGVGQGITLCHYALRTWQNSHWGEWSLHGHSHGTLPDDPHILSCDIGVDVWNFTPVSMEQLNAHMAKKTWKLDDRHKRPRTNDDNQTI